MCPQKTVSVLCLNCPTSPRKFVFIYFSVSGVRRASLKVGISYGNYKKVHCAVRFSVGGAYRSYCFRHGASSLKKNTTLISGITCCSVLRAVTLVARILSPYFFHPTRSAWIHHFCQISRICASRLLNFTAVIDCPQKRWSEVCQVISVPVKKLCEYPILVRIIITGIFTGLGSIFFLPFFVGFEGRGEVVCPVKSCPM